MANSSGRAVFASQGNVYAVTETSLDPASRRHRLGIDRRCCSGRIAAGSGDDSGALSRREEDAEQRHLAERPPVSPDLEATSPPSPMPVTGSPPPSETVLRRAALPASGSRSTGQRGAVWRSRSCRVGLRASPPMLQWPGGTGALVPDPGMGSVTPAIPKSR